MKIIIHTHMILDQGICEKTKDLINTIQIL